jgi:hypothetical protein
MPALLMTMSILPKASRRGLDDGLAAFGGRHGVVVGHGLAAGGLDLVDDLLGGGVGTTLAVDRSAQVVDHDEGASLGQLQGV